jgi:hypothetical protein
LGAEPTVDPIRLVEQFPSTELLHSVLGVSHAQSVDKLLETNIAGFVYVYASLQEREKEIERGERERERERENKNKNEKR